MLLYDFILCVAAFQPALVIRNFLLYCAHGVILYHVGDSVKALTVGGVEATEATVTIVLRACFLML